MSKRLIGLFTTALTLVLTGFMERANAAPHGAYALFQNGGTAAGKLKRQSAQKLVYYGGPVIAKPKVVAVMWGTQVNSTTVKDIGGFYTAMLNSTYMDWLTEYNTNITSIDGRAGTNQTLGRGSFLGSVTIAPAKMGNRIQDADIQTELEHQIELHVLPAPDEDTLYIVYFPPGVSLTIDNMASCSSFCAYHEGFKSATKGNIFYGAMPDIGGSCAFSCGGTFDDLSRISSHEMVEAITDAFPTAGSSPAYPQAWNATDGNEIGDLCSGTSTEVRGPSRTYSVQQEFANSLGDCAPGPYQSN